MDHSSTSSATLKSFSNIGFVPPDEEDDGDGIPMQALNSQTISDENDTDSIHLLHERTAFGQIERAGRSGRNGRTGPSADEPDEPDEPRTKRTDGGRTDERTDRTDENWSEWKP
uniref:Uncharacterized protein n=1 Tax=Caenorhabditis japonica TaxID=281687 RepID=A0A8R1IYE9_CAEJA